MKPKLLFLCQTLPFPPDGGVAIRSYNILRLLAREYDVTALFFFRRAVRAASQRNLDALRPLGGAAMFPIEQEFSRPRLIWDHLRSVLRGRVYTYYAHESAAFQRALRTVLGQQQFDIAHVDSLDLSYFLDDLNAIPVVVTHHNVESALLARRAKIEDNPAFAGYLRLQSALMRREEQRWCDRVALNVLVSEDDSSALATLVPGARTAVVPNGVDTETFVPVDMPREGIVFVGGMTWFPNRDALEWFSAAILPELSAGHTTPKVTWVGRATQGAAEHYGRQGIEITGYVDDIKPYVHRAACYVVPLRVGGGTRLKILDAWALGKAVVSTSIGCEGLETKDGDNILVRDDPVEFARAVRQVLEDPLLQRHLGANARLTAERRYSWNVIATEMFRRYEEIRTTAGGAAPEPRPVVGR